VAIAAVGIAGIIAGHGSTRSPAAAGGVVLIGVALIVWLINWMFRLSIESNRDRDVEEEARDYYARHGHWPSDDPR
jgi:threonine/homoserine/homoserine lactone efflux protein